jgi:hypothetical protein
MLVSIYIYIYMNMKVSTTSIQISTKHRNMLKKFCDDHSLVMSGFLEKLIEERTNPPEGINDKSCFNGVISSPKGRTPFGLYDDEDEFVKDCSASMLWAARRLGYPIIDIELFDIQFFACFEESVNEYISRKHHDSRSYTNLDVEAKNWIRNYFLALCKECLGMIRQKYETIPIPGGTVTLDGATLRMESRLEKETLLQQLIN